MLEYKKEFLIVESENTNTVRLDLDMVYTCYRKHTKSKVAKKYQPI
jgi:hypothetical protein